MGQEEEKNTQQTTSYLSVTMCAVHKSIGKEIFKRIPYLYDTCRPKFPYFKGMLLLSRFSLYKMINFVLLTMTLECYCIASLLELYYSA